jgi:hypothetical protein
MPRYELNINAILSDQLVAFKPLKHKCYSIYRLLGYYKLDFSSIVHLCVTSDYQYKQRLVP